MNNTELANTIVEFGVGNIHDLSNGSKCYEIENNHMPAKEFVRDWRVAGAMMEKMSCLAISAACKKSDGLLYHGWLKDPRAINEACAKALGAGQ